MARLIISLKDAPSTTHELTADRTTVGRVDENDVVVADASVSGSHCEIIKNGEDFILKDLGSTNGTFINGRRIEEERLQPGTKLKLGEISATFEAEGMTQSASAARKGVDLQTARNDAPAADVDKTFAKKKNAADQYMLIGGVVVGVLLVGALIYALIAAFSG